MACRYRGFLGTGNPEQPLHPPAASIQAPQTHNEGGVCV